MSEATTNPVYYMSIGLDRYASNFGITDVWGNPKYVHNQESGGYWLIILQRSNPTHQFVNQWYGEPGAFMSALSSTVTANPNDCIVVVIASSSRITDWGWSLDFITEFEKYGAGDVYRSAVQEAFLLSASGTVGQTALYCMASVPAADISQGYEAYKMESGDVSGSGSSCTQSFELTPVQIGPSVLYELRRLGAYGV